MVDEQIDETLSGDEALLKEIRETYAYYIQQWKENRAERGIDMRYVCGDPWEAADKAARKEAGRPCISHDELNQYVNHAINNARQNKRGIKVDPDGDSTEKESELRQDIIRTAEYRSRAQGAYLTAYQSMLEGGYGFFGISRRYVANENITATNFNDQEFTFRTFANPDSVLPDPDCKEPDWSDQNGCFVLDLISRAEFKRQHSKATIVNFSAEDMRVASDWITDKNVLRAEFWKRIKTEKKVYLVEGKVVDEVPKGKTADYERTKVTYKVMQYITNGVEILKRIPQPGTIIPIIPVTGLERYVDEGDGPKRKIFSLIRLARDPQMSLAYLASQEMEEAGLTPKAPVRGWTGQFETDELAHKTSTKIPHAYLQYDYPQWALDRGITVGLPESQAFTPNFQQYELAKDAAKRAIQAAMGISALPTAAQRNNEKSGVALDRIEQSQDIGSFHFVDNFDRALMLAGRIMNEQMPVVYGGADRKMMLRKADDKNRRVVLNTEAPYQNPETNEEEHYLVDDGSHSVTVSTGPSQQSQRQVVSDFVDKLVENLQALPIPEPQKAKVLAIAIQMKDLGPKGDALAELISPSEQKQLPPEAQAAIAEAKQMIGEMQAELQKLQLEKAGHVIDNQAKMQIEQLKIDADIAKAEIMTKAQSLEERMQFVEDAWKQLHGQAHDVALQADSQAHQAQQATQQQDAAAQQQQAAAEQQQQEPEPQAA